MPFRSIVALTAGLLLFAPGAEASISSIRAHNVTFSPGDTFPVFVDVSVDNSITVKGEFMDLATGVESSDSSFSVGTGQRIPGSNSSLEILVGAGSAPDQNGSTIHVKFLIGEETFTIKAFKTSVTTLRLGVAGEIGGNPTCEVGDTISIIAQGLGGDNLVIGAAGTMLDVSNNRYDFLNRTPTTFDNVTRFVYKCTAEGSFTVDRTWFKDSRLSSPAGDAMVRGSATLTVTVKGVPPPTKVKRP
jgi:hypothetical protein